MGVKVANVRELDTSGCKFMTPDPDDVTKSKVNNSGVYVKASKYGDGAYAARAFKKGECIEWGIVRRLTPSFDGNTSPFVFTWSDDRDVWAMTSGCAMFYNTSANNPNTKMVRFFDEDRFEIYAIRDIEAGDELTHTYRSLQWRTCFQELRVDKESSVNPLGA